MTTPETVRDDHTADAFQLGEPIEHRGIVVTPLFPLHDPRADYLALEVAIERGLRIDEVDAGGSVPELRVVNPLAEQVLLYDGEELIGAKQNRILNVSVLVGGKTELPIPVSCVEEGRWRSVSGSFSLAAHASSPQLRHRKAMALYPDPLALGRSQGEVWEEVRAQHARLDVSSLTGASSDSYRRWHESLATLETAFRLQPGQSGAVLALGDDLCLDYVSRPDAFERVYPKLLRGYMLDALERLDGPAAQETTVRAFVREVAVAARTLRPSAGPGQDLRFESARAIGSGLELDDELLQLCVLERHRAVDRSHRTTEPPADIVPAWTCTTRKRPGSCGRSWRRFGCCDSRRPRCSRRR